MPRTTLELRKRRHARIRRRLSGTAERPRVAVSRTNKHISAQIIDDESGRTLAAASSVEADLKKTSGGNVAGAKTVAELLAIASKDRVMLRTSERTEAMTALAQAGGTVAVTGHDTLTISGLTAQRIAAILGEHAIGFSGLAAHQATLEEAYMEITRDAVEFRPEPAAVQGTPAETP